MKINKTRLDGSNDFKIRSELKINRNQTRSSNDDKNSLK